MKKSFLFYSALAVLLCAQHLAAQIGNVHFRLPDSLGKRGQIYKVPVYCDDVLTTADSVISGEFTVPPTNVITMVGYDTVGTMLGGVQSVLYNGTLKKLIFANSSPVTGTGVLVYIMLYVNEAAPASLTEPVELTGAILNEGFPTVQMDNGSFRAMDIFIIPKNPPQNKVVGDSIMFSVNGDVQPPLFWTVGDTAVASIDALGKVKAKKVGQTYAKVTDSFGLQDQSGLFQINSPALNSLAISIPDTFFVQNLTFDLPIRISDVTSLGIISAQWRLNFNPNTLVPKAVLTAGTLAQSWGTPTVNFGSSSIDVAMAGSDTLTGQGVIAYVRFQVKRFAVQSSNLDLQNVLFNENITAAIDNGFFNPIGGPVINVNPNQQVLTKGDTLTYFATGGTGPYKWYSSDTAVAKVDSIKGTVKARSRGTFTLSAFDVQGFDGNLLISVNDFLASLPDTIVRVGDSVDVPISVTDISGLGILSTQMKIGYDTTRVRFSQLITAGTLSAGMTPAVNDSASVIRIALSSATPLGGSGIFAKLRFHHKAPSGPGQFTPLIFQEYQNNEASPIQPSATLRNGKITIANALNKPVQFTKVMGDTAIFENQLLSFDYNASDPDVDQIKFFLQNASPGMSIDSVNGIFTWKPSFTQAGTHLFTVVASDGKGGDAARLTSVMVNEMNRMPQFTRTLNDTSIQELQPISFDIDAFDPDGGIVKFSLVNASPGMKIDSMTGLFTWTPTAVQSGVHPFIVRASEIPGSLSDDPVQITVLNNNQLPFFTKVLRDTLINEDQQLVFDNDAVDPDGGIVRFFVQNFPPGMTVDSVSGLLVWRPTFNQSGVFNISLGIRDADGAIVTKQVTVSVNNVNRPPLFTSVIAETTFTEPGLTTSFLFAGQDPDNDPLNFTGAELPIGATISPSGQFTWIPSVGQTGTHRLVIKMDDLKIGVLDTSYFVVKIVNTPPFFTSVPNDTTVNEMQTLTLTYAAADNENDPLTYSITQSAPAGLSISAGGVLTWTPTFEQSGIHTVAVQLQDQMFVRTDTVRITVLNVNRMPQFISALPDFVTFVDSTVNFKYSAVDPDNDPLQFSFVKAPASAVIQSNGTFSWKPVAADLGKDTFIVRLSDGTVSLFDTAVVTVTGFPFAEVSQTNFDFGSVTFGGSKTVSAVIRNRGVVPLFFHAPAKFNLPPDPNFIVDTAGTSMIPAGSADTISFTYLPKSVGGHGTGITFMTNDFRSPSVTFILNGSSIATLTVKKRMMVDIGHSSTAPLTDTVDGMGVLFAYLSNSGIQVNFSGEVLQPRGNDVLLLVTPQKNYSRAEIDSVSAFVKNGGLVIALANSAQEGSNAALNSLLTDTTAWKTGLSLNNDIGVDSSSSYFSPFAPLVTTFTDKEHPFLTDVDTLVFFGSSSITVSGTAVPFATTTAKGRTLGQNSITQPVLIALSKIGKGKILLTGDADAWRVDTKSDSIPPNIAAKDNLAFVLNVLSITEDYEVKMPAKTPNEQYRLVSIPYDLENGDMKSVLKELGNPNPLVWRLFGRYDPVAAKYAEFPSDKFNTFKRGEAYWLITRGEFDLNPGTATIVPVQSYYPITIGPGYSIVGNPFPYRVSWKNSIHDSVQNVIWGFDGTTFKAESLAMAPFTGYFVKNLTKDSITIYINPQDITTLPKSGLGKNENETITMRPGEWRVGISATSGKNSDNDNFAGVAPGAKTEYDANDISEPPATPTDYVIVRFPNREWKQQPGTYAVDIRAEEEEGLFWDFEVITAKAQSKVDLALNKFGDLPNDFSLYLIDKTTERAILLTGNYQYQFSMMKNETRRNFRLIAGKNSFVEQNTQGIPLVAMEYELMQNYPNPFNPSTQIRYVLGHSGHVTLEIYNVLGQRIRTLRNEFQSIGTYNAEWDGRNDAGSLLSTGVYFYRVQVTANGESAFMKTNKMVLMK